MNRKVTVVLASGVLVAGLAGPLSAAADADDQALAFVAGAAVGYALNDDATHLRHPHRGNVVKVHRGYHRDAHYRWPVQRNAWHKWQRARWKHHHRKAFKGRDWHPSRFDRRFERRFERRHHRFDRRDHRRHDRHDRRHERHDRRHDRRHRRDD